MNSADQHLAAHTRGAAGSRPLRLRVLLPVASVVAGLRSVAPAHTGIQGHRHLRTQAFEDTGIRGHKNTCIRNTATGIHKTKVYSDTGTPEHNKQGAKAQRHSETPWGSTQRRRHSRTQVFKDITI